MFQLGERRYEGLLGFEALSFTREANYKEHELVGAKPSTQRVGDKLETMSLTLRLHNAYCVPEDEIDALENNRVVGYILGLYSAAGRYYGDYLIKSLAVTIEKLNPDASILVASVGIELTEYFYADRAAAARRAARQVAFALESNAVALPEGTEPTPAPESTAGQTDTTPGATELPGAGPVVFGTPAASAYPGPAYLLPDVGTRISKQAYTLDRLAQIGGTATRLSDALRGAQANSTLRPYLLRYAARTAGELTEQHGQLVAALSGGSNPNPAASGLLFALSGSGLGVGVGTMASILRTQATAGNLTGALNTAASINAEKARIRAAAQPILTSAAVGRSII